MYTYQEQKHKVKHSSITKQAARFPLIKLQVSFITDVLKTVTNESTKGGLRRKKKKSS